MSERPAGLEFLDSIGRYLKGLADMFYLFIFFYAIYSMISFVIELIYTILFALSLILKKIFGTPNQPAKKSVNRNVVPATKAVVHPVSNKKVSVKLLSDDRIIGFVESNKAYGEFNQLVGYYRKRGNDYVLLNANGHEWGKAVCKSDGIFEVYNNSGECIALVSKKNIFQKLDKNYEEFVTGLDADVYKNTYLSDEYALSNAVLFLHLIENYRFNEIFKPKKKIGNANDIVKNQITVKFAYSDRIYDYRFDGNHIYDLFENAVGKIRTSDNTRFYLYDGNNNLYGFVEITPTNSCKVYDFNSNYVGHGEMSNGKHVIYHPAIMTPQTWFAYSSNKTTSREALALAAWVLVMKMQTEPEEYRVTIPSGPYPKYDDFVNMEPLEEYIRGGELIKSYYKDGWHVTIIQNDENHYITIIEASRNRMNKIVDQYFNKKLG